MIPIDAAHSQDLNGRNSEFGKKGCRCFAIKSGRPKPAAAVPMLEMPTFMLEMSRNVNKKTLLTTLVPLHLWFTANKKHSDKDVHG